MLPRNKSIGLIASCLLLACGVSFADSPSGSSRVITPDDMLNYAEKLFDDGEFRTAASEFRRYLHFFPEDPRRDDARFRIGEAFLKARLFRESIAAFRVIIDNLGHADPAVSETAIRAFWMISECHRRMGEYGMAVLNLKNLLKLTEVARIRDEAFYRTGWLHLERADWEKAGASFRRIRMESRDKFRIGEIETELLNISQIPRKEPFLAGLLSIIPGLGQIYGERYQDAAVAFLVNAVLFTTCYEAFDNNNEALGGAIGLVGAGFYSGNIYGAVRGARHYNQSQVSTFIEKMKDLQLFFDLSDSRHQPKITVGVRLPF